MADDQITKTGDPVEKQGGGTELHPHRRAILRALGAAPVILTLTSRLAHGYEGQSASQDPCYVPRNPNTPPPDPDQCPQPPPGT